MMKSYERLIFFIQRCYKTRKAFAQKIGEAPNTVYRYGNSNITPSYDKLAKFQEAGLSIDWLVTGLGGMYAFNAVGLQLQDEHELTQGNIHQKPFDRLKEWIIRNYASLQDFSITMNINYQDLNDVVLNNYVMEPEFIRLLEYAGCSMNWLVFKVGDEYSNSPIGNILKMNKEKMDKEFCDNPPEYLPAVYYYGNEQKSHIVKLIQTAIKEELGETIKELKS